MNLPGIRLLRIELLTLANLGSAAGEATLDRPTQKEVWAGLPYLPDSALKGVFAGRYGDVLDQEANPTRERFFGSPDRPGHKEPWGRPASFVFGNAELLAFPLPTREGECAWVFPALAVARCLRFAGGEEAEAGMEILRILEEEGAKRYFAWPSPPRQPALAPFTRIDPLVAAEHGSALESALRRLAGPGLPQGAALLVVSTAGAGLLWRAAAEPRTATALNRDSKTAKDGSLRRAELIPAGSVFVSLVSSFGAEPDLSKPVPIGAWESLGLGWVQASWIETTAAFGAETGEQAGEVTQIDATKTMGSVWQAIERLRAAQPDPQLRRAVKAVVSNFGPRAAFGGLEAALAFHAAKAKPAHSEPSDEARAHRWLLAALTSPNAEAPSPKKKDDVLWNWLSDPVWTSGDNDLWRTEIMVRWHWLRRFSELGLDDIQPEVSK